MKKTINFLVYIAIILLPFDSAPYILNTTYRPISVFPIFLAFILIIVLYLMREKVNKEVIYLVISGIFLIIMSLIITMINIKVYSGFIDYASTFLMGIMTFVVFDFFFKEKRKEVSSNTEYTRKAFSIFGIVYGFVLLVGVFELTFIFKIFSEEYKEIIYSYISGRSTIRVQLLSGEPSWGSMHILFAAPIFYYLSKIDKRYLLHLLVSIILFAFMFSTQGFINLALAIFVFLIIVLVKNKNINRKAIFAKGLITISIFTISLFLVSKMFSSSVYYITRITKILQLDKLAEIIYVDGSIFVRVIFPFIGILIFLGNPIFGVGGGNYRFVFGDYIEKIFPRGMAFEEVKFAVENLIGNSKNLVTRVLSENGIVGFVLLGIFVYLVIRKYNRSEMQSRGIVLFWIITVLLITMQFDSFAYLHIWVMLALVNNFIVSDPKSDLYRVENISEGIT